MTTKKINDNLKIVKLKGDIKFKTDNCYYLPEGYCFKHEKLGYFSFKEDNTDFPYIPCGGIKALKSILAAGGLLNFDNAKWLQVI